MGTIFFIRLYASTLRTYVRTVVRVVLLGRPCMYVLSNIYTRTPFEQKCFRRTAVFGPPPMEKLKFSYFNSDIDVTSLPF